MINKKSFVAIANMLDEYFNGETFEALGALGIYECKFTNNMDTLIGVLSDDIDPECYAEEDIYVSNNGDYLCEWLFGDGEFNEICPTAEALYDYINKKYEEI